MGWGWSQSKSNFMNTDPFKGQILPASLFGRLLTELSGWANTIVEIGTWRGGGSTACIVAGLNRPEQRFYAVESCPNMIAEAKAMHSDSRIVWLNGAVSPSGSTPIILDQLPDKIDLLLIDGGEDTGESDFNALWERSTIIALDDTHERCRKNKRNRQFLIDEGWKVLADFPDERNGWFVAKRP